MSAYAESAYSEEVSDEESTDSDQPSPESVVQAPSTRRKCSAYPEPIFYQNIAEKESTYRTQPVSSNSGRKMREVGSQDTYVVKESKKSDPKPHRTIEKRSRTWTISAPGSHRSYIAASGSSPSSSDGESEPRQVSNHAWGPLRWVLSLYFFWTLGILVALFVANSPRWSYSGYSNYSFDYNDMSPSGMAKAVSNIVCSLPTTWQEAVEAVTGFFAGRFVLKWMKITANKTVSNLALHLMDITEVVVGILGYKFARIQIAETFSEAISTLTSTWDDATEAIYRFAKERRIQIAEMFPGAFSTLTSTWEDTSEVISEFADENLNPLLIARFVFYTASIAEVLYYQVGYLNGIWSHALLYFFRLQNFVCRELGLKEDK